MLDLGTFAKIDKDAIRQNVWAKATAISLSARRPRNAFDWFMFGDTGLEELLSKSAHMRALVEHQIELKGALDRIPVIDTVRCMRELELPTDRMPTVDELKSNYRRLVKQCHPDLHPGDSNALQKFKSLQTTYERITGYYDQVDEAAEQLAARLNAHFASHGATMGWKDALSTSGLQSASFPTDHLSPSQKEALVQQLREHGLAVEERYAVEIGSNVISVSGAFKGSSPSAEVVQKLQARFTGGVTPAASAIHQAEGPTASTAALENDAGTMSRPTEAKKLEGPAAKAVLSESNAAEALKDTARSEKAAAQAGVAENKVVDALKNAAKSEEHSVAKAGGKTKWIVGGIIAATIAVGAFIAHKRANAAARQQEQPEGDTASRSIG